jgi:hypothetical protein
MTNILKYNAEASAKALKYISNIISTLRRLPSDICKNENIIPALQWFRNTYALLTKKERLKGLEF